MVKSRALEVNIASYHVDVSVDPKYVPLQQVMSKYYGLTEGLNTFLAELSHPYRNWRFIVDEARGFSLDYFHLLRTHPQGPAAAQIYIDIFFETIQQTKDSETKTDAVDNLLLFIQKIIRNADDQLERFWPMVTDACRHITTLDAATFFLFVKSHYQIKKIVEPLTCYDRVDQLDFTAINDLLIHAFKHIYDYWLSEEDPQAWFAKKAEKIPDATLIAELFEPISHHSILQWRAALEQIIAASERTAVNVTRQLLALPGYAHLVETYRNLPAQLLKAAGEDALGNQWKVISLFHTMNLTGLSMIHEEALRDINRTLSWLIANQSPFYIWKLIQKTFSILKTRTNKYPQTALNCVLNMGKGVYKTGDSDLVNFFIDHVIDLGFESPMISGVDNDWQIKVNQAHIQNIRVWLELIELNPKWSTRLISSLTIHLALRGVFIKDTDLFPRDITQLLNSPIGGVYNLIKQLARLFPVYFNDIGAEGKLREISTQLDELTNRRDLLIHFLRKQSHVESSNRIIAFIEAIFRFWKTRHKAQIEPFLPPTMFLEMQPEGPYIDGVHAAIAHLEQAGFAFPRGLLDLDEAELMQLAEPGQGFEADDVRRLALAVTFYKLLLQKYDLEFIEITHHIDQLKPEAFPALDQLKSALVEKDPRRKIIQLLEYLQLLKDLILSDETFEIREDIYKKRHFTIDIPSMYGSYHEMKFDALGLTFRIDALLNTLFETVVDELDLSLITKATFYQIHTHLLLFHQALKLDGIRSVEFERQLEMLAYSLEIGGFTFTQYIDIFKGFAQAVSNMTNDYFHNMHGENLTRILPQVPPEEILPAYRPNTDTIDPERLRHRASEMFFRDRIALSVGLQQLDLFLSRILNTLYQQSTKLPKDNLHQLLLYDPHNAITSIANVPRRIRGIVYLGNKGLNMVKMQALGLPVPHGLIITTEVFRCREIIDGYPPAEQNLREQIAKHIRRLETVSNKRIGDNRRPLLLSVRSGSAISQPGMMDTFLDVGINEEIAANIATNTNNAWFAWDSYRRFLQCVGMAHDLDRDDFDAIISEMKRRIGIQYKRDFTGAQMHKVAMVYKALVCDHGITIWEDPFDQLYATIKYVSDSWDSSKARMYRHIMGISDDWGTAVTIQEMVYGNLSQQSGSGVFFTHNPRWSVDSLSLWGDFTVGNQGEDVVSGLVTTLPISIAQQDTEMRETDVTLETAFPAIYRELHRWALELIEKHGFSPQELEFTFESPRSEDLYLLQTRDMAIRERKQVRTFDATELSRAPTLGHGLGVSGGAMSGRLVFTLDEIDHWRKAEPDTALILARADTVPDDIQEIFAADGLVTARGGVTSHAAVVAYQLGKTGVVGCGNLVCDEPHKTCRFAETTLTSGDYISIDGRQGAIYLGQMLVKAL